MRSETRPILLVEDNPDDVELTLRALVKNKIKNEVVVAHDGAEALDKLFPREPASSLKPALVLLDLKLPKVDGLEVLRQLRQDPRTKFLPVVILTSSKESSDLVRAYELGANSYIQKPVNFSQFIEAVQQIGLYWLLINEPAPEGP